MAQDASSAASDRSDDGHSPWRAPLTAVAVAVPLILGAVGVRIGCEVGVVDVGLCGNAAPVAVAAADVEVTAQQTTVSVADPGAPAASVVTEPTALFPGQFLKFVVVAPDGANVLYVTATSLGMQDADLWVVPRSGPKRLLKNLGDTFWIARPAWCQPQPGQKGVIAYVTKGQVAPDRTGLELWVMDGDGANDRRVLVGTPENKFGPDIFYGNQPGVLRFMAGCGKLKYSDDGGGDRHVVDLGNGDVRPSIGIPGQANIPGVPAVSTPAPTPARPAKPCGVKPFAQTDPRWAKDLMKTESSAIRSWGCALTSTAMIFNYYGVDTDPGKLNQCADDQADLLYWDPVRAKCAAGKIPKAARWTDTATWADLEKSIAEGKPAIVGLQGGPAGSHFLVVTAGSGDQADNYRIVDSWDGSSYKTLADYINPKKGYILKWIIMYEGEPQPCTPDTTAPDSGGIQVANPKDAGVYNAPQKVEFAIATATDAKVESTVANGAVIDGEGPQTITISVTRGEQTFKRRVSFLLDKTPPVASARYEPVSSTSINLIVEGSDELTEVTDGQVQVDGGPWQPLNESSANRMGLGLRPKVLDKLAPGAHTLRYFVVDSAGNKSEERELPVVVSNPWAGLLTTAAGSGAAGAGGDGGPAAAAQLNGPEGVAVGPDGLVYIADSRNHRVRRINADGMMATVVGNGRQGFAGDGGPATQASLNWPSVVAFGPDGSLYVTDSRNHRVRRVDASGTISTVAGNGQAGFGGDNGPATAAALNRPTGLSVAGDGAVYVADTGNHRVRRIGPEGTITTIIGNGRAGFSGDGGAATDASLNGPTGLSAAADGLYVADTENQRIRRRTPDGALDTVAGGGTPPQGQLGDNGPATAARLAKPLDLVVTRDGATYVADGGAQRIRRIGPEGIISSVAGNGQRGFAGDGGLSTEGSLADPVAVAVAADGSFYIVDLGNNRIRRVQPALQGSVGSPGGQPAATPPAGQPAGQPPASQPPAPAAPPPPPPAAAPSGPTVPAPGAIATAAGNGQRGDGGDGGPAAGAQLAEPSAVALGPDGSLFIADRVNNRVRRVLPNGVISTFAGGGNPADGQIGDGGPATQARLSEPRGLAVAPDGTVYITDTGNGRIRKVAPDGVITSVAGGGSPPRGQVGDGGSGAEARLNVPRGLALGGDGALYIADGGHHRVRRLGPDGVMTTVAGTGAPDFGGDGGQATLARLNEPAGVAVGPDGSLYIADRGNARVRRVAPDGIISTVAGKGGKGNDGDGGPAVQAHLSAPNAVAVTPDGTLYIADDEPASRVRVVAPNGTIGPIAGVGKAGFSGDGGPAVQARLFGPEGVAVSGAGVVFIADAGNQRIRQVKL